MNQITKLALMMGTIIGIAFSVGAADNIAKGGTIQTLDTALEANGFCTNPLAGYCTIEVQTRGEATKDTLTLNGTDFDIGTNPTQLAEHLESKGIIFSLYLREKILDDLEAYQLQELDALFVDEGETTCLDTKQIFYYKLPQDELTTSAGTFAEQKLELQTYECFIDGEERSDYLDSTRLLDLID